MVFTNDFTINKPLSDKDKKIYTEWSGWCNKNNRSIEADDTKYYSKAVDTKATDNQIRINVLQKYLDDTDWYVARYAETGVEIPADVKAKRQAAREKIDELRAEIEELAKQLRATEENSATVDNTQNNE